VARPSLERVTFRGMCPACGNASIFCGMLAMRPACPSCGLNLSAREIGDGPAFFGITIIGSLATILAAVIEALWTPAYWVHAAVLVPFIIIGSLVVLRFAKACMLCLQYGANPQDFG